MVKKLSVFISPLSFLFFLCPAVAFAKYAVFQDVVYASHEDVPDSDLFLKGDIYVPSTEGQSVPFVKALKEAGADVTAVPVPGAGHYWFNLGKITGQSGLPDCEFDYKKLELVCKGATPNDFIARNSSNSLKETCNPNYL